MKYATRMLLSLMAVVLLVATCLLGEVPHLINYQGRITDGSGNPMNGTYTIAFRVYDDPTGGTILWTETHNDVTVDDGLFDVVLGSVVAIGTSVFSSQPRWLGLTLDGGPELSPRIQIVAVAYAYSAEHADTSDYAHSGGGSGWIDDGSSVRLSSSTDSVGIGTTDPQEKLHVNGDIRLGASNDIVFGDDNTRIYGLDGDMVLTADDDVHLQPDDDIYIRRDGGSAWVHFDNSTEKLGVGVMDPAYKLTVNGEISVASGGESKYHINYYQGGLNFAETGVQDRRLHIGDGGNVGIGTADPGAKLGVNGDLKVVGAYKGDISSSSGTDGAPFPRPAYDSGWQTVPQGDWTQLNHNIGGNPDDYVVDMMFKYDADGRRHIYGLGLDTRSVGDVWGCYWSHLTANSIQIVRANQDDIVSQVRVRIWVVK